MTKPIIYTKQSLIDKFEAVWKKVTGKKGGFTSDEIEREYKVRGIEMLGKIQKNPGKWCNLYQQSHSGIYRSDRRTV